VPIYNKHTEKKYQGVKTHVAFTTGANEEGMQIVLPTNVIHDWQTLQETITLLKQVATEQYAHRFTVV
jgi:hypothetical protein